MCVCVCVSVLRCPPYEILLFIRIYRANCARLTSVWRRRITCVTWRKYFVIIIIIVVVIRWHFRICASNKKTDPTSRSICAIIDTCAYHHPGVRITVFVLLFTIKRVANARHRKGCKTTKYFAFDMNSIGDKKRESRLCRFGCAPSYA